MSEEMKSIVMEGLKDLVTSEEFKTIIAENIVKKEDSIPKPKKSKKQVASVNATRPLTSEEYELIITTIEEGFKYDVEEDGEIKTKRFRANKKLSFILQLEANLGIRIGDILSLTPQSFVPNGEGGYRLNIIEEKTGKPRTFNITFDTHKAIEKYCEEHKIGENDLLFNNKERSVQKQLKIVTDYLNLKNISTHSFRKYCGMQLFINSGYNFEVVRRFYQHSSFAVTQRYLGITDQELNNAIEGHNHWL